MVRRHLKMSYLVQSIMIFGMIQIISVLILNEYIKNCCLYDVVIFFIIYSNLTLIPVIPFVCLTRIQTDFNPNIIIRYKKIEKIWIDRVIGKLIWAFEIMLVIYTIGLLMGISVMDTVYNWSDSNSFYAEYLFRICEKQPNIVIMIVVSFFGNTLFVFTVEIISGFVMWITDTAWLAYISPLLVFYIYYFGMLKFNIFGSCFNYADVQYLCGDLKALVFRYLRIVCVDVILIYLAMFIKKRDFLK